MIASFFIGAMPLIRNYLYDCGCKNLPNIKAEIQFH
jgi:hypothetical protein